jgi:nitrite reductase/ring-hydroxylating ferredoxin subunit
LRLCALAELADPGSRGFRFRSGAALFAGFLVRRGDLLTGYEDHCPHAGWLLSPTEDGFLTRGGGYILCSGHGALFELGSGACVAGPCAGKTLLPWPVMLRNGEVFTA